MVLFVLFINNQLRFNFSTTSLFCKICDNTFSQFKIIKNKNNTKLTIINNVKNDYYQINRIYKLKNSNTTKINKTSQTVNAIQCGVFIL